MKKLLQELIETLWNVNVYTPNDLPVAIWHERVEAHVHPVVSDGGRHGHADQTVSDSVLYFELIETLWNVNEEFIHSSTALS